MRLSRSTSVFAFAVAVLLAGCGDTTTSTPNDVGVDGSEVITADTPIGGDTAGDTGTGSDADSGPSCANAVCEGVCCAPGEVCGATGCEAACVGAGCPPSCTDGRPTCGASEACCLASEECVLDACAPRCASGVRCGATQACCAADEVCDDTAGACVLACPSQVFCGPQSTCCAAGELCFVESCVVPGATCAENYQCATGEYCEPTIGQCLPIAALPGCTYVPTENFEPQVEWEWTESTVEPAYNQVMMAPMVANLTDDNGDGQIDTLDMPDVVFSTFTGGGYGGGFLRVVSGDDGHEHYTVTHTQVAGASSVAIGDIDGDDRPEIVAVGASYNGLVVLEDNGDLKWTTTAPYLFWGGATLVDLDQDGDVEILAGSTVFDHLGNPLWDTVASGCGHGRYLVAAADVDRDGAKRLEVITGQCVLDAAGNVIARLLQGNGTPGPDGFPAIGNFDNDVQAEIVVVSAGAIHMYEHDGTFRWTLAGPGGNLGPPTIGNFIADDAFPEIAVAGASNYVVIDERDLATGSPRGEIVFDKPTTDASSNVTGSSIFDFEGDGVAEAVYNDECFIHVYDTRYPAGDVRSDKFKLSNSSGTTHEYPIVVDVDNDGNAELIAIRNDYSVGIRDRCIATWPDFDPNGFGHGIRVFGDRQDNWVATRRIWNQHAYWVTNISEDGKVPRVQERNYEIFNNFRQNSQSDGLFFAPDLVLEDLTFVTTACPTQLSVSVVVRNGGAQGVGKSLPVSFYFVMPDGSRQYMGTAFTQDVLLPGNTETVTLVWEVPASYQGGTFQVVAVVDDPGDGSSLNNECREDNNELAAGAPIKCEGIN